MQIEKKHNNCCLTAKIKLSPQSLIDYLICVDLEMKAEKIKKSGNILIYQILIRLGTLIKWAVADSNRRPLPCQGNALNQLS